MRLRCVGRRVDGLLSEEVSEYELLERGGEIGVVVCSISDKDGAECGRCSLSRDC